MLDAGYWMLDPGYLMLDARFSEFDSTDRSRRGGRIEHPASSIEYLLRLISHHRPFDEDALGALT